MEELRNKINELKKRYEYITNLISIKELEKLKELENAFKSHFEKEGYTIDYDGATIWAKGERDKYFFFDYNNEADERYKVISHVYENGDYPGCKFELVIDLNDYKFREHDLPKVNNISLWHEGIDSVNYLRLYDDVDKFVSMIKPEDFKLLEIELETWEKKIRDAENAYKGEICFLPFKTEKILNTLEDILNNIE